MARLHHMGITVSDTEKSLDFFRTITEITVTGPLVKSGPAVEAVTRQPGAEILITFVEFADSMTVLELAEYRGSTFEPLELDTRRVGACHAAIVVLDIAAAIDRVKAAGWRVTAPPQVATSGPMEGMKYTYAVGPDGLTVELLEDAHAD